MHTAKLTGQEWIDELIEGHNGHFHDAMSMHQHIFQRLVKMLEEQGGLTDTKHVTKKEQVGIFLYAAVTGLSNRKVQEQFQRSSDTVSKCVDYSPLVCSWPFLI